MSRNFVHNDIAGQREQRGAVWLTAHGSNEILSVAVGTFPKDGSDKNLFRQIAEGTVLSKRVDLGVHYPLAYDTAQAAVVGGNDIVVSDVLQFQIGQLVELPAAVASDSDRFRLVTDIDYDTNTITLDGATFSLSEGDAIEVDPGRSLDVAVGAVAAATDVTVTDGTQFAVGDTLEFSGDTSKTIDSIAGNVLTLSGNITIADGSRIVSGSDGEYKVTHKTITIDEWTMTPQNVLMPYRPHGRLKEILVIGLTPTAKTALSTSGLLIFDARTIA